MNLIRLLRSRRCIALLAIAVLLLLDLGRSILARQAMTEPVSTWKPDPTVYADMPWPPAEGAPAGASRAERLYFEHCAICHGPDGRGNGSAAPSMIPRPRDLTEGLFKYKSTPSGAPPSDDDLYAVLADGLSASAMPGFKGILKPDEIHSLIGVVKAMSPAFARSEPPIDVPPRVAPTADSLARGKKLYAAAGCPACHGDDLRGGKVLKGLSSRLARSDCAVDVPRRLCPRPPLASPDDRPRAGADAVLCAVARRERALGRRQLPPRQPARRALGSRRRP